METASGFDLESLRPGPRTAVIGPGDLLEITVWDLYEPGKPYTFPVRVSDRRTIEAPLVGEISTSEKTPTDVESDIHDAYRDGEFLVNPRVLVRSLDPPTVKVQAGGAVLRAGFVELSRSDSSVYAALVSAGGLKKNAGTQVSVTRRSHGPALAAAGDTSREGTSTSAGFMSIADHLHTPQSATSAAIQHANSSEELSVGEMRHPGRESPAESADQHERMESTLLAEARGADEVPTNADQTGLREPTGVCRYGESTRVYDVANAADRDALRAVVLGEGDEIHVSTATPPVRIGGVVRHPGPYPLPPGGQMDVWQVIERAGGLSVHDVPLNITLIRPATESRPASRKFIHVSDYSRHPAEAPALEPGDVLHVEPTAGGKIRRAVGDIWNKP